MKCGGNFFICSFKALNFQLWNFGKRGNKHPKLYEPESIQEI